MKCCINCVVNEKQFSYPICTSIHVTWTHKSGVLLVYIVFLYGIIIFTVDLFGY